MQNSTLFQDANDNADDNSIDYWRRRALMAEAGQAEVQKEEELRKRLKPHKTFGLNVSGDVMVNKMEVEIINTQHFQRLAYVKQLGSTNTVYRSANHTRFEHSLGVLKMAELIVQKIKNNVHSSPEERNITVEDHQIIRLLALLHDIGHMPFGHTIEDEFNIFPSHDKHETRWDYFLGADSPIGQIIIRHWGTDFHERFYRLIKCEKDFRGFERDAFMYDIVSNTVCADLIDYLKRDVTYTNLKLDFHLRFLDYLFIKTKHEHGKPDERRIVIRLFKSKSKTVRKDVQSELVQLLRNRFYLGERVYYHPAKIKTGSLAAGAVLRAFEAGFFKQLRAKKTNYNGDDALFDIHTWGDEEMLTVIKNASTNRPGKNRELMEGATSLAQAFLNRTMYNEIECYTQANLEMNPGHVSGIIDKSINKQQHHLFEVRLMRDFADSTSRLQIEDKICSLLPGLKSGDFLIYFPNYKMQMKLAEVQVEDGAGVVVSLKKCHGAIEKECADILNKHQDLWLMRIFVHPRLTKPQPQDEEAYRIKFGADYSYDKQLSLIRMYCKMIVATDGKYNDAASNFWKEYVNFMIDYQLEPDADDPEMYSPVPRKTGAKSRSPLIEEIAGQLTEHTHLNRTMENIVDVIKDRFLKNKLRNETRNSGTT